MGRDGRAASVVTTNTVGTTSNTTAVQVALRIRPLTQKDRTQPRFANVNDDDCLKVMGNTLRVVPHNKLFTFDHVFGPNTQQHEIFSTLGENLVHKFIEGYNVTVLAYGQTSSGKTFTMGTAQHNGRYDEAEEGIVPRAMALLFEALQLQSYERPPSFLPPPSTTTPTSFQRPASPTSSVSSSATSLSKGSRLRPRSRLSHVPTPTPTPSRSSRLNNPASSSASASASNFKYTVKVSFVEIYNEELNDLLNDAPPAERPPVTIREDTKGHIYWTGVKEVNVSNADDVLFYLEQGTKSRATGATDMNEKSSRSHAIFSVTLQQEKSTPIRSESPLNMKRSSGRQSHDDGECVITTSKFHFVDLAGSERLKRTAAEGDRRKEGININAGLHALGNVISALGDLSKRGTHVPYRDSKLTRLLQDSLGGNATTLMIACASPVEFNLSETLNTLQYANRARNIKNRSEKNQVEEWMTTDNLELLRTLIGKLKNEVNYLKSTSPSGTKGVMSSSATIAGFDDDDDDDDHHMDFDNQDADQLLQEHRLIIADLQHQIEELDGEASVTRERNKMVEVELQRLRKLEQLRNKKEQENLDFEHLVEPVIEEYEKSIAKLESELSVSRAALNHSNIGLDDLQTKYDDLQRVLDHQQESMSDLQLRFTKIVEREQNNDAYIEELESKLEQSAHDSMRDQDTLNELRNRVVKWKENEDNNEHYIQDLEKRLAVSEENHNRLATALEALERQRVEQDTMIVDLQQQVKKASENGLSQQQSILNELDNLNEKYTDLEKERDQWKIQAQQHQESNQVLLNQSAANDLNHKNALIESQNLKNNSNDDDRNYRRGSSDKNNSHKTNRRSLADEKETSASYSALAAKEAMVRAEEQASRVRVLEMQLEKLGNEHKHTIKELDTVLQRYHEALEQVDHLEHNSTIATKQPSSNSFSTLTDVSQPSSLSSSSFSDDRGGYHTGIATPTTAEGGSLDDDNIHGGSSLPHSSSSAMGCLLDQEMGRAQDQEHRHTITHLEQQVKTLQDKMDVQQQDLESIQKAKQQQRDSFEDYITTLKSTIQRLETEGEDAAQLVRKLEQLAEDHDDFVERTVLQLDEATESNDSLVKQYTTTQTALKTLQQKHRSVIEERNDLTLQLERLKQEYDETLLKHRIELESSSTTATMEQQHQHEKLDSYFQQMDELKQTIDSRDQELARLMEELTETRDLLQQSQASHREKMEAVMTSAAAVQHDLEKRVQQLEQESREKEDQHERQLKDMAKSHTDLLEKERLEAIQHMETTLLEHQTEYDRRLQQWQKEAMEKDAQYHTQLTELTRTHQAMLEKEKLETTKALETLWLERQAEWTKETMEQHEKATLVKEDQHQQQLEELSQTHRDLLDKEKTDALKQQETTWLDRQKEWDDRVQQLEQDLLENDDRHQTTLKEISRAHTEMMDKDKADCLEQLESSWLERQAEWTARIDQMEQEALSKDHQYHNTLTELDQSHTTRLEEEKSKALKELESSWLERQMEWTTRVQALEQEILDSDQRHQDTVKEITQAHTDLLEQEKANVLEQIESSWLERQTEWMDRIARLEKDAVEKDKKHQEAIDEHVTVLEKDKASSLKQLESLWLDKQALWEEDARRQLEQEALESDHRHQVTVKELSQAHTDLLNKEKSDSLKQLEATWTDRQLNWNDKMQNLESDKTGLITRVTSLESDLDTAKKDLLETQTKLDEAEEDLAEFEDLLHVADSNLETMTTRAEEAENTINILETVLADAVKENETLNERLKGMDYSQTEDQDYQALAKECEEAHQRVKQLEQQLEEETVTGIKSNHVDMDRHSASSSSSPGMANLNDDLLKMETLYHQSDKHHEITTQKLNDALSKVSLYESQLSSSENQHQVTTQKLNDALSKVSLFESQLSSSENQHSGALADHLAKMDDMEKRYQQQKSDIEAAKDQLEASHQLQIQQLKSDHDSTLQQQHLEAQALKTEELAALEKRYDDKVARHNDHLEELERQHDDTLDQLSTLQQTHTEALSELLKLRHAHDAIVSQLPTTSPSETKETITTSESLKGAMEQIETLERQLASVDNNNNNNKAHESELKKLAEENEEYAELTNTLEQELNRITQEMDKLVIEVGDNEVTLQEQTMQIQQLQAENKTSADELKQMATTHQDQVQALEQKNHQLQTAWDQDKQQKDKLTKQVKILEEKLEILLQEKKKFLCF